jgi:membrane-associated phospholipid phosphatase
MRKVCLAVVLSLGVLPAYAQSPDRVPAAASAETGTEAPAAAAADQDGDSFFRDLWRDLPRLGSKANLFTLGAGGAIALAIHHSEVSLGATAASSEELDEVLEGGGASGNGWVQIGGALGTYALGHAIGNDRVRSVGVDLVQAQLLNAVLTQGIKFASSRRRPDGGSHSFPSGHTSGTFATAMVLSRQFGWKAAVPAYTVASYVAASRVQENHHYISDVVFGAAVGMVSGRTVTVGMGGHRFGVSPALVPGGGAVMLTRRPPSN